MAFETIKFKRKQIVSTNDCAIDAKLQITIKQTFRLLLLDVSFEQQLKTQKPIMYIPMSRRSHKASRTCANIECKLILFHEFSHLFTKHFRILSSVFIHSMERKSSPPPSIRSSKGIDWCKIERKKKSLEEPSNTFYCWFIEWMRSETPIELHCSRAVVPFKIEWGACVWCVWMFHFDLIWVVEITFFDSIVNRIETKPTQISNVYIFKINSKWWIVIMNVIGI